MFYSLAPRFVVGVHINSLHMEPSPQMFRHEASLNDTPSVGVNQVSVSIDVKAQEGHGDAVVVEEDVRVGTKNRENYRFYNNSNNNNNNNNI